jgi:hypothetical protein
MLARNDNGDLPDAVHCGRSHRRPWLTREGLTESRRVHEDSVDAILTRGVWVGFGGLFGELVGAVYAPTLCIAEEEALSGRVAEGILASRRSAGRG